MAIFGKDKTEEEKKDKKEAVSKSKEDTGNAYKVLVKPLLTEKTNKMLALNQVAFRVAKDANKIEVKKAVERVYDVHVLRVNMVSVKGKVRNFGRRSGRTSDWKKAIITLKPGEAIQGAQV